MMEFCEVAGLAGVLAGAAMPGETVPRTTAAAAAVARNAFFLLMEGILRSVVNRDPRKRARGFRERPE